MTTQEIPVTQADLDAAADLIETYWSRADDSMMRLAKDTRAGHRQGAFPRAFARHRHAAESASRAQVERLRSILEGVASFLQNAPLESGVCCCGDEMDNHDYHSGHSPVDQAAYVTMLWVKDIRAAIAKATGNG